MSVVLLTSSEISTLSIYFNVKFMVNFCVFMSRTAYLYTLYVTVLQ
jgi:hypothetical protein